VLGAGARVLVVDVHVHEGDAQAVVREQDEEQPVEAVRHIARVQGRDTEHEHGQQGRQAFRGDTRNIVHTEKTASRVANLQGREGGQWVHIHGLWVMDPYANI
jgi:hypothetical protein